ncbi:MAG: hypothetical protein ABW128_06855 [Rhizorhabdus sp.]
MAKTDPQRLVDLKAALKTAKPKDTYSLQEVAALWGVSKPRFVNKRAEFAVFPEPIVNGNTHLYPAREAIKAMIAHLERHQQAATERARRTAALIGGGTATEEMLMHYSPAEIASMNRTQADIEQRERDQRLFVHMSDVEQVAGSIFSILSDFASGLSNRLDPHGRLAPELRAMVDTNAQLELLKAHREIKGLLENDAVGGATGAAPRKAASPRARRKR